MPGRHVLDALSLAAQVNSTDIDPTLPLLMWGTAAAPSDSGAGYNPGCIYIRTAASNVGVYVNVGTAASCNFDVVTVS